MTTAAAHDDPAPVAARGTLTTTDRRSEGTAARRILGRLPLLLLQLAMAVLAVGYAAAGVLLVKAAFALVAQLVSGA